MSYRTILIRFLGVLAVVFVLVFAYSLTLRITLAEYLWFFVLVAVIYLPASFIVKAMKPTIKPATEHEKIIVENDLAHFKGEVQKALAGNPVAQRNVEMHLINAAAVDLSIRYGISETKLREKMGDKKFLSQYMGHAGVTLANMFERRHDLKEPLSKDEFLKSLKEVMEAMK